MHRNLSTAISRRAASPFLLPTMLGPVMVAQTSRGTLTGTVTDSTGALVSQTDSIGRSVRMRLKIDW